jgi:hypothetical protein
VSRKNGNGEGSRPRERADGRWEARCWVGGKRSSFYGSTRKGAADRLAKAVANSEEPNRKNAATTITVWEFFAESCVYVVEIRVVCPQLQQGQLGLDGPVAVGFVDVGVAEARGLDLDDDLSRLRLGHVLDS